MNYLASHNAPKKSHPTNISIVAEVSRSNGSANCRFVKCGNDATLTEEIGEQIDGVNSATGVTVSPVKEQRRKSTFLVCKGRLESMKEITEMVRSSED